MATRNLTKKFLDIRNGAKATRRLDNPSLSIDLENPDGENLLKRDDWKGSKAALPPAWVDDIELVEEQINQLQSKMKDLNKLHTDRLMVDFTSNEAEQEREIDHLTEKITSHFRNADALLKRFGKKDEGKTLSNADLLVRKNAQGSMAKKLQGLSSSFRNSQREYMARLKAQKSGAAVGSFDYLAETKKVGLEQVDTGFTQTQMMELENMDQLVNERDQEILRIAKSIEELATIFKELAVLVIDQGTILDRIDFNMEQVIDNTTEGIKQLEKAEENQKNALPFRCIILLVFLIVVMMAALIYKHQSGSK